ncbi:MAG: type II secretion system F family protein [Lentisphaeria bacterium]|jgi:tight adherence protein C
MGADVILIQLLAFMASFLFVLGVVAVAKGRRQPVAEARGKPAAYRAFSGEVAAFANLLEPTVSNAFAGQTKQIQDNLVAGAVNLELREVRGMQGFAATCLGVLASVGTFLVALHGGYAALALGVGFLLGWIYPVTWVQRQAQERKDAMSRSLPFAIDLITVAMEAGQDFGAAVRNLVKEGPKGPLAQEFAVALRHTELGKSRVEALKAMAARIQLEEFRTLVTAVIQSSEMGASIVYTMKIQAEEIRRARYHRAERKAARAPSLMLIPMALFILPAVFIIIFTPVIIRVMDSGIGQYFGGG